MRGTCPSCQTKLSFPVDADKIQCPKCGTVSRRGGADETSPVARSYHSLRLTPIVLASMVGALLAAAGAGAGLTAALMARRVVLPSGEQPGPGLQDAAAASLQPGSQGKAKEKPVDIADFIDNTPKYKGKTITMQLHIDDGIDASAGQSLRNFVGRTVRFYGFGVTSNTQLKIAIEIPSGLSVPQVAYADEVRVTFVCSGGSLLVGNVAQSITRP